MNEFYEQMNPETVYSQTQLHRGRSAHPFQQRTFREKDLLRAANLYNRLDKKQHIFENKSYAQSSIN